MIVQFSKCDFWILGQISDFTFFLETKIKKFEIEKNLEKVSKKYFSRFFWKPKMFIEKPIENFREKSFFFQKIFRFFTKIVYWFFNENFWFPKKSRKIFFDTFSRFFSISKNFIFYSKKKYTKIENLVRNPKIILRKLYEQYKIV